MTLPRQTKYIWLTNIVCCMDFMTHFFAFLSHKNVTATQESCHASAEQCLNSELFSFALEQCNQAILVIFIVTTDSP